MRWCGGVEVRGCRGARVQGCRPAAASVRAHHSATMALPLSRRPAATSDGRCAKSPLAEQEANTGSADICRSVGPRFEVLSFLLGSITATPATSKLMRARTKMSAMKST